MHCNRLNNWMIDENMIYWRVSHKCEHRTFFRVWWQIICLLFFLEQALQCMQVYFHLRFKLIRRHIFQKTLLELNYRYSIVQVCIQVNTANHQISFTCFRFKKYAQFSVFKPVINQINYRTKSCGKSSITIALHFTARSFHWKSE